MFLIPINKSVRGPRAPRSSPTPAPDRRADHVLSELLAMNEEMVVQLRVEQAEAAETTEFFASMIKQHEVAAERLRAELRSQKAMAAMRVGPQLDGPLPC
jgi:hypothetical protein